MQKIFGRLTAIRKAPGGHTLCVCSCGAKPPFLVRTDKLKEGRAKSCGCIAAEIKVEGAARRAAKKLETAAAKEAARKARKRPVHEVKLRAVWSAMWQRCTNPNNKVYAQYGGRGITVDPNWAVFDVFYMDMAPLYKEGLWLERRDNALGYNKSNCTFATPKRQARNRRDTLWVRTLGDPVPLVHVAQLYDLPYNVAYRFYRECLAKGEVPHATNFDDLRKQRMQ